MNNSGGAVAGNECRGRINGLLDNGKCECRVACLRCGGGLVSSSTSSLPAKHRARDRGTGYSAIDGTVKKRKASPSSLFLSLT